MRVYILLFLLIVPCAFAAKTTMTVTNGSIYELRETLYTVLLVGEDVVLLEKNGTRTIMHADECVTNVYTRSCLTAASETEATFEETFIGADLDVDHDLAVKTADMGAEVLGTIVLENEGELPAKEVQVAFTLPATVQLVTNAADKQHFSWTGTVKSKATLEYRVITTVNGSYSWNASGSYFDANVTQPFTLPTVTLAATLPFTYTIGYNNETTSNITQLNVNITRKSVDQNFTYTITAVFPPEVEFNSSSRNIVIDGSNVTYKKTPNSSISKFGMDVLYRFTAPPSAPLNVTIRYKNGTTDQTLHHRLPFTTFADTEPAMAVSVDPLTVNESGIISVTIPGEHTGVLTISGPLLTESRNVTSGTHTFTVTGSEPGNYTHSISFTTTTVYGNSYTARGSVEVAVAAPVVAAEPEPVASIPEPVITEPVIEEPEPASRTLLYVAIAAAAVLLVMLFLVIHSFSDPLRRLEKLTERTAELRTALAKKRRQGKPVDRDEERLAELEVQLSELSRKL